MKAFDFSIDRHVPGCARAIGVSTHTAHGYHEIEVQLWWATVYISLRRATSPNDRHQPVEVPTAGVHQKTFLLIR